MSNPLNSEMIDVAGGSTKAVRRQLAKLERFRTSRAPFEVPDFFPCVIEGLTDWATSQSVVEGDYRAVNDLIYICLDAGTTGNTAPSGKGNYIRDDSGSAGTVWACLGYRAPIAFANSTAMVLGQLFAANGLLFKVTTAGTTHASDPAPSTAAAGTNGTVGYVYYGPQTLPIVTISANEPASSITKAGWNDPKLTIKGGTLVQRGSNSTAHLISSNLDGVGAYQYTDGGQGGRVLYQTDAPLFAMRIAGLSGTGCYNWINGKFAALVAAPGIASTRYVTFDASGIGRQLRDICHRLSSAYQFGGIYAYAADTLRKWTGGNSGLKVIHVGDSFTTNSSLGSYAPLLGDMLGIADYRIAGIGTTGIMRDGDYVSYTNRFTVDVIDHDPDLVIIQASGNDTGYLDEGGTIQEVADGLSALIDRVRNETGGLVIIVGIWNRRQPWVSGDPAYDIDVALEAVAETKNVPFIPWRDLLTDGGYAGTAAGTGSSLFLTYSDGVHPSFPAGHMLRAKFLLPRILEAVETLIDET